MKIRTGFVSNSSSSSFCIFGIISEMEGGLNINNFTEEAISYLKLNDFLNKKEECDCLCGDEECDECVCECENDYLDTDTISTLCDHFRIDYWYNYGFSFGTSWRYVGDNQTGQQFKESVKERLSKVFNTESKLWETLGTHEEAWHD